MLLRWQLLCLLLKSMFICIYTMQLNAKQALFIYRVKFILCKLHVDCYILSTVLWNGIVLFDNFNILKYIVPIKQKREWYVYILKNNQTILYYKITENVHCNMHITYMIHNKDYNIVAYRNSLLFIHTCTHITLFHKKKQKYKEGMK